MKKAINRLTGRVDMGLDDYDEICFVNPDDPEGMYNLDDIVRWGNYETKLAIAERICEYEDTGLTPEEITALKDKIERGELVEVVRCEYELYRPSDDGYTGDRRYYQCNNCNQNYISINDDSLEWDYCPYCRAEITARETLCCVDCEHAEYDGDSYYCENNKGLYSGENVDDVNFDGCDEWKQVVISVTK